MKPMNDTSPKTRKYLVLDKETVKNLKVKSGVRAGSLIRCDTR
jgi:hypothetical protein